MLARRGRRGRSVIAACRASLVVALAFAAASIAGGGSTATAGSLDAATIAFLPVEPTAQAIYAEGIATRNATFETEPPEYESFDASRHDEHRFVAVGDGRVVGWAALAPTSSRACYAGVAESSVYVAADARGRGVGRALMEAVVASAAAGGIWTIHAGMFPENAASIGRTRSSAAASPPTSARSVPASAARAPRAIGASRKPRPFAAASVPSSWTSAGEAVLLTTITHPLGAPRKTPRSPRQTPATSRS